MALAPHLIRLQARALTNSKLDMMLPNRDSCTTRRYVGPPLAKAKADMIISVALPKLAFSRPPSVSLV